MYVVEVYSAYQNGVTGKCVKLKRSFNSPVFNIFATVYCEGTCQVGFGSLQINNAC